MVRSRVLPIDPDRVLVNTDAQERRRPSSLSLLRVGTNPVSLATVSSVDVLRRLRPGSILERFDASEGDARGGL